MQIWRIMVVWIEIDTLVFKELLLKEGAESGSG
jgi:hypothetical protein